MQNFTAPSVPHRQNLLIEVKNIAHIKLSIFFCIEFSTSRYWAGSSSFELVYILSPLPIPIAVLAPGQKIIDLVMTPVN